MNLTIRRDTQIWCKDERMARSYSRFFLFLSTPIVLAVGDHACPIDSVPTPFSLSCEQAVNGKSSTKGKNQRDEEKSPTPFLSFKIPETYPKYIIQRADVRFRSFAYDEGPLDVSQFTRLAGP